TTPAGRAPSAPLARRRRNPGRFRRPARRRLREGFAGGGALGRLLAAPTARTPDGRAVPRRARQASLPRDPSRAPASRADHRAIRPGGAGGAPGVTDRLEFWGAGKEEVNAVGVPGGNIVMLGWFP